MTRDEAATAVMDALAREVNDETPEENGAFAVRLATALEALGLLNFATAWEQVSDKARIRFAANALTSDQVTHEAPNGLRDNRNSGNVTLKCDPGNFGAAFSPQKGDD